MTIRFFLGLFFVFLASIALSQPASFRYSENENSSRVALRIPESVVWSVVKKETGYLLKLDGQVHVENLSSLQGISNSRVSEIVLDDLGQQIDFRLRCGCKVNAFRLATNWLVLDFIDDVRLKLPLEPMPQSPDDNPVSELDFPVRPLLRFIEEGSGGSSDPRSRELETELSRSLERAIAQGLLGEATGASGPHGEDTEAILPGPPLVGFTTHTSIDLKRANLPMSDTGQKLHCVADASVDILNWSMEEPFAEQIGNLRSNLMGEFDQTNSVAVEALAKLYLHFGLGREVKILWELDGIKSSNRTILDSIAEVMEGDHVLDESFTDQYECDGDIALWAFMALDDTQGAASIDVQRLVRTFKNLPYHLQELLGPKFSRNLRKIGEVEMARLVLRPAQEDEGLNDEVVLEASNISLAEGESSEAISQLDQAARTDSRMSSESLFQLLGLKIENDEPISDDLLILLQSMKFETKDPSELLVFSETEVRVLVHQGRLDDAFSKLRGLADSLEDSIEKELEDLLSLAVLEIEDDIRFLELFFGNDLRSSSLNENKIAERLISLRFFDEALDQISGPSIGTNLIERRNLRAQISDLRQEFESTSRSINSEIDGLTSEVGSLDLPIETMEPPQAIQLASIDDPTGSSLSQNSSITLATASALIQESEYLRTEFSGILQDLPSIDE